MLSIKNLKICLFLGLLLWGSFLIQGQNEFITVWQTTAANETITIPTTGAGYNYSVDWGDGSTIENSF